MTACTSPFVLIHGLIGSLRELIPGFTSSGQTALSPDLLGYGEFIDTPTETITLPEQVEHLLRWLDSRKIDTIHMIGHSVGGAIGFLFAAQHPNRMSSFVCVEGNFTLADAFWTRTVSSMSLERVEGMMNEFLADPAAWLARSGIGGSAANIAMAERLLRNQPGNTVLQMAKSVVSITGQPRYLEIVRAVLDAGVPLHLLAGERSRGEWNVPGWVEARAASQTIIPETGHMMMVEKPREFVAAVEAAILKLSE